MAQLPRFLRALDERLAVGKHQNEVAKH